MPPRPTIPVSSLLSLIRPSTSTTALCRRIPIHRTLTTQHTSDTHSTTISSSSNSSSNSPQKPQLSDFKRPFAKCFLGAMFTYQVLYWTWLKLETDEIRAETGAELARLEDEARRLTSTAS